jgi:energy-coupling factor transport system ATP-binding protein
MICLSDVSFHYDTGSGQRITALDGFSLVIQRGEYCSIIGANGSGKSTLARHLNALLLPSSGEVTIEGMNTQDETRTWEIRRLVGMVFQNPDNQLIATTVEEDVAFGPENLGLKPTEIRRRVDEALSAVGLVEYRRAEPAFLSGGQKQRLAIAGVLAMCPSYIVLDEPTSMLDPVGRNEVLTTLERLNAEQGIAIIHITHSMSEAIRTRRTIVMDNGRVVLDGVPRDVFKCGDELRQLGLELPPITELADRLHRAGVDIPTDILSVDEMVRWLCG